MVAKQPRILVVGSINMDLVVKAPRLPQPGETIIGDGFNTHPGGKGANQAVAAAKLGAECSMIGRVGDDEFGDTLKDALRKQGVSLDYLMVTPDCASGVAMITVDGNGENSIVVAGEANACVSPDDVFCNEDAFQKAELVMLQLELPLPTVRAAVDVAKRNNCKIILDPAPAPACLPPELCEVDVLSPNVSEAEAITGKRTGDERGYRNIGLDLVARGAKAAVLKLGAGGSLVVTADGDFKRVPAYKVEIVDTTAAGDSFTAGLAVALAEGKSFTEAAKFANAVGALACSRLGAQSATPSAAEVKMLMDDQPL